MKQFFRTIAGKTILFIVCMTSAVLTLISLGFAIWMLQEDFYTHTKTELYDEMVLRLVFDRTYVEVDRHAAFIEEHQGKSSKEVPRIVNDNQNYVFEILYNGRTLVQSQGVSKSTPWDYRYQLVHASDDIPLGYRRSPYGYEIHSSDQGEQVGLIIRIAIDRAFPHNDAFSNLYHTLGFAYSLRYSVYALGFAFGLIALSTYIALLAVAARRKGSEELHPGLLSKMPFDLLLVTEYLFLVFVVFRILHGGSGWGTLSYLIATVATGILLIAAFIGTSMSAAARIKQGNLIKGSLTYRIPVALWRRMIRMVKGFGAAFLSLKSTPRILTILLVLGGLFFLDLVLTVASIRSYFLVFWVVKNILVTAAVLYVAASMCRIRLAGRALANGELSHQTSTQGLYLDFKAHAQDLNSIARGMAIAVEDRMKSERMKTELITNVSHDIKTPLTSIINYTDLIDKANKETPPNHEKITEYSEVLTRQSGKLKNLIEDLVEASKASTGNLEIALAPADASLFLSQICGEYADRLAKAQLTPVVQSNGEQGEHFILADSRRMWRVFDNVMNNICKYSLPGTRVYIGLESVNGNAVFHFKNTSKEALNITADELFERFTRGDKSRSTEGNGLGLSIARSLVELQGGTMEIAIDGDLFKVTISFPKVR